MPTATRGGTQYDCLSASPTTVRVSAAAMREIKCEHDGLT